MKLELKLRGLPVSGTKMDLIERLKPFQDTFCVPASSAAAAAPPTSTLSSVPMEVTATAGPAIVFQAQPLAPESMSSTSPVSPAPTDPSVGVSEAASESKRGLQPLLPPAGHGEKDRRLHEKERQIEELMRKLEQEQRLVEELKMQLEVEKRGQVVCATEPPSVSPTLISTPPSAGPAVHNSVKMEGSLRANCSPNAAPIPSSVLGSQPLTGPLAAPLASVVKLEDVTVSSSNLQLPAQTQLVSHVQPGMNTSAQRRSPSQTSPQPAMPNLQQFFISHHGGVSQVLGQPQTLLTTAGQAGTQILLPVTLPSNAAAIQLPNASLQVPSRNDLGGVRGLLSDGPVNESSFLSARPAGRSLQPGPDPGFSPSAAAHQGGDGVRPAVSAAGPSRQRSVSPAALDSAALKSSSCVPRL